MRVHRLALWQRAVVRPGLLGEPFRCCDPLGGLSKLPGRGPFLAFLSRPAPLDPFASSPPPRMLPAGSAGRPLSGRGEFFFCEGPCEPPSGTRFDGPGLRRAPGPISPPCEEHAVPGCTCYAGNRNTCTPHALREEADGDPLFCRFTGRRAFSSSRAALIRAESVPVALAFGTRRIFTAAEYPSIADASSGTVPSWTPIGRAYAAAFRPSVICLEAVQKMAPASCAVSRPGRAPDYDLRCSLLELSEVRCSPLLVA